MFIYLLYSQYLYTDTLRLCSNSMTLSGLRPTGSGKLRARVGNSRSRLLRLHFATGYLLGSNTCAKRKREQDCVEVKLILSLKHPYRKLGMLCNSSCWDEWLGFYTLNQAVIVHRPPWEVCVFGQEGTLMLRQTMKLTTAWTIRSSLKEDGPS